MFAIIELGSAQHKVSEGDTIQINRLKEKEGKKIVLDQVLLVADGQTVKIGQPYLKDAKVNAEILGDDLGPKTISYKFKRRKGYKRKRGHRQKLTNLSITKISCSK